MVLIRFFIDTKLVKYFDIARKTLVFFTKYRYFLL